jgi:hypothetical protein
MGLRLRAAIGVSVLAAGLVGSVPAAATSAGAPLEIRILSNRADLVSGAEALVQLVPNGAVDLSAVHVNVDGRDVTSQLAARPNGKFEGLVTGFAVGVNHLNALLPSGSGATITITNHPNGGPVFSGPQIHPWTCPSGAVNAQCDMTPTYSYQYKSSVTGGFSSYDPNNPPPDVATTTTDNGHTVPYIVRQETGMEDRDQYQIAVLFDPSKDWKPWAPQAGWNGKMLYNGGASCGVNHGSGSAPNTLLDTPLSRGFAVVSTALDNLGHNCNLVVSAESILMAKEHFVNHYGEIRYTIGNGCSGGSIFQQQDENAYPGLLDGLQPNCSFPDAWSTAMDPTDCKILLDYWDSTAGLAARWTAAQQAAVAGDSTISVCQSWVNVYRYTEGGNPSQTNTAIVPCGVGATSPGDPNTEYNAQTNPRGVRCDLQDYMIDELGLRPAPVWGPVEQQIGHGFANRPYDNVGVQYGLKALKAGTISAAQFADVNAKAGGFDIDANPTASRTTADSFAVYEVYRGGYVNETNNLARVPIIDLRGHDDAEIHSDFRSYVVRARLNKNNGTHGNQIIWTGPAALVGDTTFQTNSLVLIDQWLHAIETDTSSLSAAAKAIKDKPAAAIDACYSGVGNQLPSQTCPTLYPYYSDPRIEAGMSFTDDVIKCQLKPLSRTDYGSVRFTAAEWAQLRSAFPTGVCDYSKAGVSQSTTVPWLTYQNGPGGESLGAPPVSVALAGPPPAQPFNVGGLGGATLVVLLLAGIGLVSMMPYRL